MWGQVANRTVEKCSLTNTDFILGPNGGQIVTTAKSVIKSDTYIQMYKHVHTYQLDQNRRTEKHFCMKTETLETNHKIMYDPFLNCILIHLIIKYNGIFTAINTMLTLFNHLFLIIKKLWNNIIWWNTYTVSSNILL